ncbi:MAG: hypothetical protein U9R36_04365, partial [Elusimicrobiota bacterium]|nr:hypothetical protein [Elusimicrobiota bacterium]
FINLRSIMSDYSIISFDLSAPEEFDGVEKKILFSSVYNSAKEVFPNTLEMEGARIQVLASHTRNFATAYGALSEFLNALESRPEFISPSLIRYKINSKERVLKKLNNPLAPLNTDVRPASLKYSFTQFIFNLGVTPGIFLRYVRRATPLAIYIIFTLLTLFLITLYRGKTLETKLRLQRFSVILLFGIFIYITALARHISTGKIYSQMTVIFLFVTAGIMGGQKFLKNKDHRAYLSYFKGFIMLIGIFFILIPTVFETLFTPMFFAAMVLISASGGFLFGGAFFLVRNIYLDSYRDKAYNFNPEFTAAAVTAAAAVLIIPVTGIIDILPATGILALGCLIVLSIQ